MKVLAVTDGELEAQSLRQALTSHGHLIIFSDRRHFLERIRAVCPDVLVMDVLLSPGSPLQEIREARAVAPGLWVVAVDTAKKYPMEFYDTVALEMGADAAVLSPVGYERLNAAVEAGARSPRA